MLNGFRSECLWKYFHVIVPVGWNLLAITYCRAAYPEKRTVAFAGTDIQTEGKNPGRQISQKKHPDTADDNVVLKSLSLVFSVWLLVKVDCNRERNREITGIGGLMAWREEGKSLSIFTAILKALTAEMYPSIPLHDLMIRAASEGNGVLFSPPNP